MTPARSDRRRPDELPEGAFRDILLAVDRDRVLEAWPTVSFRDDDEATFLGHLRERMVGRVDLRRRGVDHGSLAVVDPRGVLPPLPKGKRRRAKERERWFAGQPLVFPGRVSELLRRPRELEPRRLEELARQLLGEDGLAAHVKACLKRERGTRSLGPQELEDPERDLQRLGIVADGPNAVPHWIKVGRLSLHPADRSLRLRLGFGREGDDDASREERAHRETARLGKLLIPGMASLLGDPELGKTLETLLDHPVGFTQPIGYWNAPEGGARLHHDAFGDPELPVDQDPSGQLGVAYVQITGRTVWIALSIADLADRTREFLGWLEDGEAPWIVDESLGGRAGFEERLQLARSPQGLVAELARPGCGSLGPLVERGSEFTGALIDAGHGCVLRPGDVILLPNHGPQRTAMHSVFCAGRETGYGLSLAVRRG